MPVFDRVPQAEALRYLGRGTPLESVGAARYARCEQALCAAMRPKIVWREFSVDRAQGAPRLAACDVKLSGRAVQTLLDGCDRALLVAGTLGAPVDRLIDRAQLNCLSDAVVLDAQASAAIERWMDLWQVETEALYRASGLFLTRRFSPGYGDFPLSVQADLADALSLPKAIGVYLLPSLVLSPLKSVTALVGLTPKKPLACENRCALCAARARCAFARGAQAEQTDHVEDTP